MLIYNKINLIEVDDWNKLVKETYSRDYNLQQQNGCMERQIINLTIPSDDTNDKEMNEKIPEEVNGDIMGVKFSTWLARDPKQLLKKDRESWSLNLFWERNFYPDLQTVANDLHAQGLVEAGKYIINIDW